MAQGEPSLSSAPSVCYQILQNNYLVLSDTFCSNTFILLFNLIIALSLLENGTRGTFTKFRSFCLLPSTTGLMLQNNYLVLSDTFCSNTFILLFNLIIALSLLENGTRGTFTKFSSFCLLPSMYYMLNATK